MRVIKPGVFLVALVSLSSCGTNHADRSFALSDGAEAFTFRCPADWANCYKSANSACGAEGFVEIDRASAGSVTNAGRMDDPANAHSEGSGIYKEDVRQEDYDRVLTVRCK